MQEETTPRGGFCDSLGIRMYRCCCQRPASCHYKIKISPQQHPLSPRCDPRDYAISHGDDTRIVGHRNSFRGSPLHRTVPLARSPSASRQWPRDRVVQIRLNHLQRRQLLSHPRRAVVLARRPSHSTTIRPRLAADTLRCCCRGRSPQSSRNCVAGPGSQLRNISHPARQIRFEGVLVGSTRVDGFTGVFIKYVLG